ncbi:sensor histidine kinase [Flavihumibacter profundi]|uniref:sensor histidine kinase n=1 Tax=Flavihumibacter profundi TaxID=2716883 RepID=UPI001CC35476|nr:histidine kinase [Flavihumibacter profundi]MBZ5858420.1 histidine kinase [Flavihumibacter profundi]
MSTIPFSYLTLKNLCGGIIFMIWQLHFFTVWGMGFPLRTSFIDSMVNIGVLTFATMAIIQIFRYYHPPAKNFWFIIIFSGVCSILLAGLAKLLMPLFNTNDAEYTKFLNLSTGIRGMVYVLAIGFIVVLNLLWNMLQQELEAKDRRTETQTLAREAELFKLRQQLQPHFLFNSLNSINAMVVSRPQEARKMIEQLSTFLRATINRKEDELVPFREEMEQIDRYLQIEKLRFGHRLQTSVSIDEACNDAVLPPLILQPIVENAIKFGLYDTVGEVTIQIETKCENNNLAIKVTNPFDPETSPENKGTGFGLSAVQRRLYLLFGRQDLLTVSTGNNQYITSINIPQLYANRHTD